MLGNRSVIILDPPWEIIHHLHISHNTPRLPPKVSLCNLCFPFSWVWQLSHKKLNAMLMQNLRRANKVYCGRCSNGKLANYWSAFPQWRSQKHLRDAFRLHSLLVSKIALNHSRIDKELSTVKRLVFGFSEPAYEQWSIIFYVISFQFALPLNKVIY